MNMFVILLLVATTVGEVHGHVGCIGENGNNVDMFIIYKLPNVTAEPGNKYLYLDSDNVKFKLGDEEVSSVSSPPGRTLNQIYKEYVGKTGYERDNVTGIYTKGSPVLAHLFYNDAVPYEKYVFNYGHTKGELAFDKKSGFWMIQSVPNFPTRTYKGYGYPRTGYMYGQMMMCITFQANVFNTIASQLKLHKPRIYDGNLPNEWESTYDEMHSVLHGDHVNKIPFSSIASLWSLAGVEYKHFAKSVGFNQDLYGNLVAPNLKTNLVVESWQHGKHVNIGPYCNDNFTVVDVKNILIKLPERNYMFDIYHDHSKFAISEEKSLPYVCVGDINRQYPQFRRGGGTMCVENAELWDVFHDIIAESEKCAK